MKTITTCAALTLLLIVNACAQKLPGKQEKSVRAPANIKVDGIASEWNNTFMAHNNATDISYTLSNDDEKLYLTIQAVYHDVIDKILRGGITLTVNYTLKKKDENAVTITYPVLRDADMWAVSNKLAGKINEKRDSNNTTIKVDDLNQLLETKDKLINVSGIASIPDPSISVYNDQGLKAVSKFDSNLAYTCELAIPLKFLALPNSGEQAFSYQIKINPPAEVRASANIAAGPPAPPILITALATTDFGLSIP
ncbi:MAG: hypothetical protein JWR50_2592 [Mucilaginibacter sp.]|nr:hypothetical protein [Mucilaginibacter sp.]